MIKVIPTHNEIGSIRGTLIGHLNEPIYHFTTLEMLQLKESIDVWFEEVRSGRHANK